MLNPPGTKPCGNITEGNVKLAAQGQSLAETLPTGNVKGKIFKFTILRSGELKTTFG
jgi:hypothetical protein